MPLLDEGKEFSSRSYHLWLGCFALQWHLARQNQTFHFYSCARSVRRNPPTHFSAKLCGNFRTKRVLLIARLRLTRFRGKGTGVQHVWSAALAISR